MAMGFNAWFTLSDRLKNCDHDTLNMIDNHIENGRSSSFSRYYIRSSMIASLTSLRGRHQTYLDRDYLKDLLNNPYYAFVDDVINHSHLTQITNELNAVQVGHVAFRDVTLAKRFLTAE
jgi:hypothetical protein